jgi:hypothetical protein
VSNVAAYSTWWNLAPARGGGVETHHTAYRTLPFIAVPM